MGVRRGLEVGEEVIEEEGVIIKEIRWEGERWKVGTVYVREKLEKTLGKIKEVAEEKKDDSRWLVGGGTLMRKQEKEERWRMERRE